MSCDSHAQTRQPSVTQALTCQQQNNQDNTLIDSKKTTSKKQLQGRVLSHEGQDRHDPPLPLAKEWTRLCWA